MPLLKTFHDLKIICICSEISIPHSSNRSFNYGPDQRRRSASQVSAISSSFALRSEEQSAHSVEMQFSCCCHAPAKLMAIDSTPLAASLLIATIEVIVAAAAVAASASTASVAGQRTEQKYSEKDKTNFVQEVRYCFWGSFLTLPLP